MAERTGCPILLSLWSYVIAQTVIYVYIVICDRALLFPATIMPRPRASQVKDFIHDLLQNWRVTPNLSTYTIFNSERAAFWTFPQNM
jgi:hypothetical protein